MKILQVNAVNGIFSTGRICIEYADYLEKHNIECYTAYSLGLNTSKSKCISRQIECKYHAFMSRLTGLQGYYSFFSTRLLISFIEKVNPTIVHLHNLHANYISLKPLFNYLAKNNIPTLITLHDCWFYTGKCTHYSSINCNKWVNGCNHCLKLKEDHNSWFFDQTKKMWNDKKAIYKNVPRLGVVGVSDWITNEAKRSILSSAKIIKRIYNWVDTDIFHIENSQNSKKDMNLLGCFIILGVASRWSNKKGLLNILLLAEMLDEDEKIVLVGNMPNIRIPKNVISIPSTDNIENLVHIYNAADVFIQISEEESFGKVVAEALSCGVPVITNRKTANPELVTEECGLIIEDIKSENIHEAIKKIKTRKKGFYSNNCREFALNNFRKSKCIDEYISIAKDICGEKK